MFPTHCKDMVKNHPKKSTISPYKFFGWWISQDFSEDVLGSLLNLLELTCSVNDYKKAFFQIDFWLKWLDTCTKTPVY